MPQGSRLPGGMQVLAPGSKQPTRQKNQRKKQLLLIIDNLGLTVNGEFEVYESCFFERGLLR